MIFLRALRGQFAGLVGAVVGLCAFETLIPIVYKAFGADVTSKFLDAAPPAVKQMLETQFGLIETGTIQGWLGATSRHPIYLILLCAVAISMASGSVAKEVERRTILFVLTRPVSRVRFIVEKSGATLLVSALFVGIGLAAMVLVTHLSGEAAGVDFMPFVWISVNAFLLLAAIAGIATAVSAAESNGGPVIALSAGITLAFYFLDFLASLWDPAKPLGPISLFHYYNPSNVLTGHGVPLFQMGVLGAVALAGFAASVVIFVRRDISA